MNELSRAVLAQMDALSLDYALHEHPPILTTEVRVAQNLCFDACICKNLLLTTRNENRFLLVMFDAAKRADLRRLRDAFGTTRLGFASDHTLLHLLGQTPGSVGVSGIVRDTARRVEIVLDQSLHDLPRIAMHPGDNTQTVVLSGPDLLRFARHRGHTVHFFDFAPV